MNIYSETQFKAFKSNLYSFFYDIFLISFVLFAPIFAYSHHFVAILNKKINNLGEV